MYGKGSGPVAICYSGYTVVNTSEENPCCPLLTRSPLYFPTPFSPAGLPLSAKSRILRGRTRGRSRRLWPRCIHSAPTCWHPFVTGRLSFHAHFTNALWKSTWAVSREGVGRGTVRLSLVWGQELGRGGGGWAGLFVCPETSHWRAVRPAKQSHCTSDPRNVLLSETLVFIMWEAVGKLARASCLTGSD